MWGQLFLLAAFVASMLLMSFNYRKRKRKIFFFGDSITEQGLQPEGFVSLIANFIKKDEAEDRYELTGAGVSGNKLCDLDVSMNDVLAKGPDAVIILAGVNDVWQKLVTGFCTDIESFRACYDSIIQQLIYAKIEVIICTPMVIGEKTAGANYFDEDLDRYCLVIKDIAAKHHFPLVDLRTVFKKYNLANNTLNAAEGILTADGVHLNEKGNELVAKELWKAIRSLKLT